MPLVGLWSVSELRDGIIDKPNCSSALDGIKLSEEKNQEYLLWLLLLIAEVS